MQKLNMNVCVCVFVSHFAKVSASNEDQHHAVRQHPSEMIASADEED